MGNKHSMEFYLLANSVREFPALNLSQVTGSLKVFRDFLSLYSQMLRALRLGYNCNRVSFKFFMYNLTSTKLN
jgi:hypothetical protein